MKRRARGEGSVYFRASDQRWVGELRQRGRRIVVYGASAKDAADRLRVERTKRARIPAHRVTVAEWVDRYLDDAERDGAFSAGTALLYRGTFDHHARAAVGSLRLGALEADDVRDLLADLERRGVAGGVRRRVRQVLKGALDEAFMRDMIPGNVVLRVRAPKIQTGRRSAIDLETALKFIAAAQGDRYEALYLLLLCQALREGEAFGLRPEDVDLRRGRLHVRRQLTELNALHESAPKGGKVATIPLAPLVVPALERALRERAHNRTSVPYLFTAEKGGGLRRSTFLRKVWHPFLVAHDLPRFVPHQLRHTTATLLKAVGTPVEVAREILRHASINTTATIYQDEVSALQTVALARLSEVLGHIGATESV